MNFTQILKGHLVINALNGSGPHHFLQVLSLSPGVEDALGTRANRLGAFVATTTSTANLEWVEALGADIVIDYRKDDFATIFRDYDLVLNSLGEVLGKSLQVLKSSGKLVSISGRLETRIRVLSRVSPRIVE